MQSKTNPLPRRDSDLQSLLREQRKEAEALKQCFTSFSFQAIVFSSVILGAIIRFAMDSALSASAVLVGILILAVARIGIHKYSTANRIYGFQLFVERLESISPDRRALLTDATLDVGWEEAMRAWRIVQASVFEALYQAGGHITVNTPTARNLAAPPGKAWWDVTRLISHAQLQGAHQDVRYYAGSYLSTMLTVLCMFLAASITILLVGGFSLSVPSIIFWEFGVFGFTLYAGWSFYFINRRQQILESELLSIHSCSIMWEAAIVAHNRALRDLMNQDQHLQGYTAKLTEVTQDLLNGNNLIDIHNWFRPRNTPAPLPAGSS